MPRWVRALVIVGARVEPPRRLEPIPRRRFQLQKAANPQAGLAQSITQFQRKVRLKPLVSPG